MEIELADAVAAVRDELLEAAERGAGADIEFVVGTIKLEFDVELKVDAKAKTGFKAWVVTADAEAGVARTSKHRVSIELTPRLPSGGDLAVAGDRRLDGPGDVSGHIGR
ncbi:hypothetical protein GCM10010174_47390 [Kutzneria viridogrisea]|uniref:Trypsin-co-occurring domain-containing protein n=1 Tax=Kutzneria viridogrisea TaxID=47990 RepID=A0ABR6B9N6_9PSEU|nr:hypothetical protein [Kutzneria viridogrisea]